MTDLLQKFFRLRFYLGHAFGHALARINQVYFKKLRKLINLFLVVKRKRKL